MKVLVLGNSMVGCDSLPLRILPALRSRFPEVVFKEADTSEDLEAEGRDPIILDSAFGIEECMLIEDLDRLDLSKTCSMHDFDLPITLRLLKKLHAIDSAIIIAVPAGWPEREALEEVSRILEGLIKGAQARSPPSS